MFKVLNNLVPNPGFHWEYNERTGYRITIKKEKQSTCARLKTLLRNSPLNKAAVLFNKLPVNLRLKRDNCLKTFKKKLDNLLKLVPDEPDSIRRAASTNSLIHQLDYKNS